MDFFSEREGLVVPRDVEEISETVRDGVGALIRMRIADGSFGQSFPENCPDVERKSIIGTDEESFRHSIRAWIPSLGRWPWVTDFGWDSPHEAPGTLQILDAIEFCWEHIADPREGRFHDYFGHSHLYFNQSSGQANFRQAIEDIFRRNGLAYRLTENGRIQRVLAAGFDATVTKSSFQTGDDELDRLLTSARTKFLDPDIEMRSEALEALWDAWERLKTLDPETKKPAQIEAMLDAAAGEDAPVLRQAIGKDARQLTDLGNDMRIRHSETYKEMITLGEHLDYLFYRLFNLILLILRRQNLVGVQA